MNIEQNRGFPLPIFNLFSAEKDSSEDAFSTSTDLLLSFDDVTTVLRLFERLDKNLVFFVRSFGLTSTEFCSDLRKPAKSEKSADHDDNEQSEHNTSDFSLSQSDSVNATRASELFEKIAEERLSKEIKRVTTNLDVLQKIVSGTLTKNKKKEIELSATQKNKLFSLIALEQMKLAELMVETLIVTGEIPQITQKQLDLAKRLITSKIDFLTETKSMLRAEKESDSKLRRKNEINMFVTDNLISFENTVLDRLDKHC